MTFKDFLREAGEYASATLMGGAGGGSGGFDDYGNQLRTATKDTKKMPPRKGMPPLGNLYSKKGPSPLPTRKNLDNTFVKDLSMNSGGSGYFA